MNKEQLEFFYNEIMGLLGWDDGDEASGVDPLLWAKKEYEIRNVKLAQLRAELDDWNNAKKFVADGCTDEIHCGCVPILKRELDAKTRAVEEARALFQKAYLSPIDAEEWLASHPEGKES